MKLQDFIAQKTPGNADAYRQELRKMNRSEAPAGTDNDGMVLKRQSLSPDDQKDGTTRLNGILTVSGVLILFVALLILLRKRRNDKK